MSVGGWRGNRRGDGEWSRRLTPTSDPFTYLRASEARLEDVGNFDGRDICICMRTYVCMYRHVCGYEAVMC